MCESVPSPRVSKPVHVYGEDPAPAPPCVAVGQAVCALRSTAITIAARARTLHGDTPPLVLDFSGVVTMTLAFADELISGLAFRREHLTLTGLSEDCREEADLVLRRKKLTRVTISLLASCRS